MTVKQLIEKLQDIVQKQPEKENVDVYIYVVEEVLEEPIPLTFVDDSISDRVDLNT